ncbi:BTAD domain-containing putative transcriptional regulator [Streptomyces aureoverticillatus]|uniref:BTAD domain-containing putative transcriptional regulator n=1 Tax=Streptomyces aureoverticillatus TaxID=66871 RepID=UPI0013DD80AB|nr:BTAD domain-containing putative transcriptional regulator [Streptomyces aureoverticillatus]QIB43989.1 AAA family ATPase [Streptomyces aureoverticillatus]
MRFEELGPLVVRADDGAIVPVPEPKVRALLAALLVRGGRPVQVDTLVDDLWADRTPTNPANSLQTKVSQLRRALAAAEPGGRDLVTYGPAGYTLRLANDATDAARFTARTTAAYDETADPRKRAALLTDALALWRGPAYADFRDAEFTRATAARLEEQRLTAEETLAELRLDLGEHALLADELADLTAREPLRERLRAAHMRALYRAGRPSEALDAYQDLRRRLADDLGTDPGPEVTALHEAILRQDPSLAPPPRPAPPAAPTPTRPHTNLPARVTDLIGRDAEISRVRDLVRGTRLVTLTGPGGVGKTRLALEASRTLLTDHADEFPDGAWLVELAGTGDDVAETVAAALGIREDTAGFSARPAIEDEARSADTGVRGQSPRPREGAGSGKQTALAQALAPRHALLVLDNCEHLLDPVADLVAHLLRKAPHLHILTTSQEPLALTAETLETVAPLPEAEALRLFEERATATTPGFTLNPENLEAASLICRRLDGIPLAVELAATRVRTLGVHALADRLHDRFRLLNQVRRDAPARQRTLRAMIDWSWELLTPPEQRALRQLAVFPGGFTLESAESVLDEAPYRDPHAAPDEPPVLDLITRLTDRSLLTPTPHTPIRHRMLESVAAYSLERLEEAGESKLLRHRHALHYTDLAERAAPALHGPDQHHWLRRLDAETVNLRAALEWATTEADATLTLRLVNSLTWYWFLRGRLSEALRWIGLALDLNSGAPARENGARATAATSLSAFGLLTGEDACAYGADCVTEQDGHATPRARWLLAFARCGFERTEAETARVDALLDEFRTAGDRWGEAATLSVRATRALYAGDLPALRADATRSAALFAELGDRWGQLQSSEQLGVLAEIAADYDEAARLQRDGMAGAEELELWTDVSFRLSRLGRLALLTGDDARADEYHERAARLAVQQSHRPAQQFAETGLALAARRRGDLDTAERHLLPWLDFNRRFGIDSGTALLLAQLGYVAEQRGDAPRAETLHREGLAVARGTGDNRAVALALEGLAGARSLVGDHPATAALLGEAAALRQAEGTPLPPAERADVDRATTRSRTALGTSAYEAAYKATYAKKVAAVD